MGGSLSRMRWCPPQVCTGRGQAAREQKGSTGRVHPTGTWEELQRFSQQMRCPWAVCLRWGCVCVCMCVSV